MTTHTVCVNGLLLQVYSKIEKQRHVHVHVASHSSNNLLVYRTCMCITMSLGSKTNIKQNIYTQITKIVFVLKLTL